VLLLDEPFRGVDINARHDIGATVRTLTRSAAVLVATSDLDEALEVGDRIVVLNHGEVVADLPRSAASRAAVIEAMSARPSALLDPDLTSDPSPDPDSEHPAAAPEPEAAAPRGGPGDGG
jgi:simple sugar transport system ATP-binding protein